MARTTCSPGPSCQSLTELGESSTANTAHSIQMLSTQDAALPLKLDQLEQVVDVLSRSVMLKCWNTCGCRECGAQFWRLWQPAVQQLVGERFRAGMKEEYEYGLKFAIKSWSQSHRGKGNPAFWFLVWGVLSDWAATWNGCGLQPKSQFHAFHYMWKIVYNRFGLHQVVWQYPAQNT